MPVLQVQIVLEILKKNKIVKIKHLLSLKKWDLFENRSLPEKKNTRGNIKAEITQSLSVKIIAVQHVLEYSSQCNETGKK